MTELDLYTIADYAERVGCSRAYIYKLEKQKRIKFYPGKEKINAAEVDPIVKYVPAGRRTSKISQRNGGKRKKKSSITTDDPSVDIPQLSIDNTIDELDRIKAYEQARKLKLANDLNEGITVVKAEVIGVYFTAARKIRAALEPMPARVTPIIIGMDAHETEQVLKKEVNRILMNLAEDILK